MNYTTNYHLPQWVKSDRIMMDDFNAAMSDIDAGLTTAVGTADDARTDAAQAKQTATAAQQSVKTWKNYAVGSYTGSGQGAERTINVGFRPSFLIVAGMRGESVTSGYTSSYDRYFVMTGGNTATECIQLTANGFKMPAQRNYYPDLNDQGRTYNYIAFR